MTFSSDMESLKVKEKENGNGTFEYPAVPH